MKFEALSLKYNWQANIMVNKIILWLSIIINKRVFFFFFCSQSRYLSRKCPNFLATCVWNPGVTWSSLPSCSWSATTRLLYKKPLWSLFYFWHWHKKTKQKTDTSVLAYWDKGSTAFCKSLEPLTLNSLRQIFLPFLSVICRNISPGFLEDIQNSFLDVSAFCYGLCQDDPTHLQ